MTTWRNLLSYVSQRAHRAPAPGEIRDGTTAAKALRDRFAVFDFAEGKTIYTVGERPALSDFPSEARPGEALGPNEEVGPEALGLAEGVQGTAQPAPVDPPPLPVLEPVPPLQLDAVADMLDWLTVGSTDSELQVPPSLADLGADVQQAGQGDAQAAPLSPADAPLHLAPEPVPPRLQLDLATDSPETPTIEPTDSGVQAPPSFAARGAGLRRAGNGRRAILSDLRLRNVQLEWHEAVAVVQELADTVRRGGRSASVPDLTHIVITESGELVVLPGSAPPAHPVTQLARTLQELLEGTSAPPELRLLVSDNASATPKHASVEDFSGALALFERPGRQAAIADVAARALSAEADSRTESELERLRTEARQAAETRVKKDRHSPMHVPRRKRWILPVAACAVVLLGLGAFWLQGAARGPVTPSLWPTAASRTGDGLVRVGNGLTAIIPTGETPGSPETSVPTQSVAGDGQSATSSLWQTLVSRTEHLLARIILAGVNAIGPTVGSPEMSGSEGLVVGATPALGTGSRTADPRRMALLVDPPPGAGVCKGGPASACALTAQRPTRRRGTSEPAIQRTVELGRRACRLHDGRSGYSASSVDLPATAERATAPPQEQLERARHNRQRVWPGPSGQVSLDREPVERPNDGVSGQGVEVQPRAQEWSAGQVPHRGATHSVTSYRSIVPPSEAQAGTVSQVPILRLDSEKNPEDHTAKR